ncbi:tyrosine-type recombinase/integrase [Bacillus sp. SJS]|uniref:tyrosine-type recombinase/integrase n=1 Tax=Bacillus sp. SJS TaxID=1423321 RepID=UPI0004DD7002|nr:tyrosine-type recombinase/integrase [Bacillus sp. SJS]KZZ82513.1 hypothetical protein AS29_020695 [Bacillus sp. SJS]
MNTKTGNPIVSTQKLKAMMDHLQGRNRQDFILFSIGIHTWLKFEDLLMLKGENIGEDHIKISESSTKKLQRILISEEIKGDLVSFIRNKPHGHYLFYRETDREQAKTDTLSKLKAAAEAAGIPEFDEETMRKTFVFHALQQDFPLPLLQEALGFPSPDSVLEYIGMGEAG